MSGSNNIHALFHGFYHWHYLVPQNKRIAKIIPPAFCHNNKCMLYHRNQTAVACVEESFTFLLIIARKTLQVDIKFYLEENVLNL